MREARETKGLTQAALAFKAGIAEATIRRIETGRNDARQATLVVLAGALEIEVEELVGRAAS